VPPSVQRPSQVIVPCNTSNIEMLQRPIEYAVDWFNHRRLLEPGNMPPAEREDLYYEQQGQAKKAA